MAGLASDFVGGTVSNKGNGCPCSSRVCTVKTIATRSFGPRTLAVALDFGASAFTFESSTHRALRGAGWSPDNGRNHGVPKEFGEALPCRSPVLSLGAVL